MVVLLACVSAVCFGVAIVTSKLGLRDLDARAGAATSIPTATLLFLIAAPFAWHVASYDLPALALFALVGLFFPSLVTLLTFASNDRLGPILTSTLSGTAPLFAVGTAALLLAAPIPPRALLAAMGVLFGIALMSGTSAGLLGDKPGWALLLPILGAVLRGLAQTLAKAALILWPYPFEGSLFSYVISSVVVMVAGSPHRMEKPKTSLRGRAWFALTGLLNGSAVLMMYAALNQGAVATVAPIVAAYPLVSTLLGGACLPGETVNLRVVAGVAITAAAIAFLVSG